ncbi:hypothetical protein [Patiriisocius hiemis]|uniref:C1q domain-containing protein n=1 Tax=Patiriisocius hiemis TaxID=3075604 RepID=A0ABU2YBA0_9FLAO|nr:hypothetical protein [Constantimarinum sp. W242]MDT0555282.1 hypothetical protein [Constantimarinum sp. W242]
MKRFLVYILPLFFSFTGFAQVGIGNLSPNAQLDISAGATPSEKDGLLIPRLDEFPSGVNANQNGMLVFITGNGTPTKGFYYWDNNTTNWVVFGKSDVEKIDDLIDGKSDYSSIFLGAGAGENDDSNNSNFGLGIESLYNNINGIANTALGYRSLYSNVDGNSNLCIGFETLYSNVSGDRNIAIGSASLGSNATGSENIAIGYGAFANSSNSSNNIAIGFSAGPNSSYAGNSGIFIGESSGRNETQGNRLYIENSNADENNALIYGEFDNNILRTNSEFQIGNPTGSGYALPTTDGTAGQILTTDGNGQVSFENTTSISNFSLARIVMNSYQAMSGAGWTKINFDTVDFDINSDFNTTNDRFVVPVDGYYRVNAICRTFSVPSGTNLFGIAIYINGSRVRYNRYTHTGTSNFIRSIDQILQLSAGDFIEIRFYNPSTISISSSVQETSFEIERLR